MATIKAELNSYRQSPRKVRLVAKSLKGQKASEAVTKLGFTAKRSADPLAKLIKSAMANAKQASLDSEEMFIKEIRVDGGSILYRRGSASRGRAPLIRKRTSHVTVILTDESKSKKKSK